MSIKTFAICLVLSTVFSTFNAELNDIKQAMNSTNSADTKCPEESEENPPIKPATTIPRPKSTELPLNFAIGTKPRTVPTKRPLVINTANAVPGPAHYMRLNPDPKRKTIPNPKIETNLGLKKDRPVIKVFPKDNVTTHNTKKNSINRFKSGKFFEDDTNIESLPSASKRPIERKNKKPENKYGAINIGQPSDNNDVQIKNVTHMISVSKLAEDSDSNELAHKVPTEVHHHNNPQQKILETIPIDSCDVFEISMAPENYEETLGVIINDDELASPNEQRYSNFEIVPDRDPSVIVRNIDNDPPNIITIKNRNYEEVEERPGVNPELNNIKEDELPFAVPAWNTVPVNSYNNYLSNYQVAYDKNLKYYAEKNPRMYKSGNYYPTTKEELNDPQELPVETETQVVQDVYYGLKSDSNIIDVRPENALGKIWRTWKDMEIKISKPNYLNNKSSNYSRYFNNFNYREKIPKKNVRPLIGSQAIGFNGYYDNLNNAIPYSYSYQPYRYMM